MEARIPKSRLGKSLARSISKLRAQLGVLRPRLRGTSEVWPISKRCDASPQTRCSFPRTHPRAVENRRSLGGALTTECWAKLPKLQCAVKQRAKLQLARVTCAKERRFPIALGVSVGWNGVSDDWRSSSECQGRAREGRRLAAQPGAYRKCWSLPIFARPQPTAAQAKRIRPSLRSSAKNREMAGLSYKGKPSLVHRRKAWPESGASGIA